MMKVLVSIALGPTVLLIMSEIRGITTYDSNVFSTISVHSTNALFSGSLAWPDPILHPH